MKAGATSRTGTSSWSPEAPPRGGRRDRPTTITARRRALLHLALAAPFAGAAGFLAPIAAAAQDIRFFQIGTGGVAGTYYPIGGLIADVISSPPGARPCERGGSCGVPGLVAVAQSSNGSVANVRAVDEGELESGFAQSDVAHWAYTGTGAFAGEEPMRNLRAIASLYPESMHLVARLGAGIESVRHLAGKRVSLDEPGSGTLLDARIILGAYGLTEDDLGAAHYVKPSTALSMMHEGELDAFFIVAGYPTASVAELAETGRAKLIPISGSEARALINYYDFFERDVIPAGTYEGIGEDTETISVGAQWIVNAALGEDLVYGITRALWHPTARELLDNGHAKGREITLTTALKGLAIPLHPGAERYYREAGVLPATTVGAAEPAPPPSAVTPSVR